MLTVKLSMCGLALLHRTMYLYGFPKEIYGFPKEMCTCVENFDWSLTKCQALNV